MRTYGIKSCLRIIQTDSELLTDYCDGQIFKQHPFFKDHPNALRLHFYEDEFEVVNPLGSKRTKQAVCLLLHCGQFGQKV